MDSIRKICLLFLLTLAPIYVSGSGDFCTINGAVKYCEYGCCGHLDNECCGMTTEAIIGIVFGGIMALVAVVSCIVCMVCLVKGHSRRSNVQPVHPGVNSNAVYVNTGYQHPPPHGHHQAPPPSYNNFGHYPTTSNNNNYNRYEQDSAYPPGFMHPPPYTAQKH